MDHALELVRKFHQTMNFPIAEKPRFLEYDNYKLDVERLTQQLKILASNTMRFSSDDDELLRRASMAIEELAEWLQAHIDRDLIATADAWADRAYVLLGDTVATGLPATDLFEEVHQSNMTKDPDPSGTGKAIKGSKFQLPNIKKVLDSI